MSRTAASLALVLLLSACSGTPQNSEPPASPTPAGPTPTPAGPTGFHLRAWYSQALPPEATFGQLPVLAIDDGWAIDGNVAIPLIFPGPLMILPNQRAISEAGQAALVELADQLGLLGERRDFTGEGILPGGQQANVLIVLEGETYELTGDPMTLDGSPSPEPGSPQAFASFWERLGFLDGWLESELGPSASYTPERMALLIVPPSEPIEGIRPNFVEWPLESGFAELGAEFPAADARCVTVSGDELEALLPVLAEQNQLTVFVDATDEARSLVVRPLVPFEPSPCSDES